MLDGAMLEGAVVAEGLVVVGVLEEHPDKSTAAPIMSAADPAKVLLWCSFMVALPKLGDTKARFFPRRAPWERFGAGFLTGKTHRFIIRFREIHNFFAHTR